MGRVTEADRSKPMMSPEPQKPDACRCQREGLARDIKGGGVSEEEEGKKEEEKKKKEENSNPILSFYLNKHTSIKVEWG